MIKNFAKVVNGVITNVAVAEDVWPFGDDPHIECPDGFGVGDLYDGTTFSKVPPPPLTQAQIDAATQAAADKAAAQAVRADAKYQALIALNPVGAAAGSVKDWVVNNFPTLTQPEKNNLTTVVQALVITARKP
jgi:hypothetical protein